MILFLEDWKKYPTAIVDVKTTNKSFLRLAEVYKRMGVRNYYFLLALVNPELQGIDPYSPNLTEDQKLMIGVECFINPWYYFREISRIPPVAGPIAIPFRANRGNIALIWLFYAGVDVLLIQPRQTGKSVSTDTLMVELIYLQADNSKINMITKDDSLRRANVERLKKIRDLLPKFLIPKTKEDSDNQYELTCRAKGNSYSTGVAQNSESSANNLGRGLTAPIQHIDEGPFVSFIGITLPAALASATAAREEAKHYGRPFGNIFTTTAGKKDDRDGRYMYDMMEAAAIWDERMMDSKNSAQLIEVVKKAANGRKLLVNCTFSHLQLGLTDAWLYDAISNSNATGEAADRDFFNRWTSGTQSSPLTPELNERIRQSEKDPSWTEITPSNFTIRWYIPEDEVAEAMANGHFVMGMDTSDAIGRDGIGAVMINIKDLSIAACITSNETNLIHFSNFVADFLIRWDTVLFNVERRSSGQTVIDTLLIRLPEAGIDPFKRIYNTIVDEPNLNDTAYRDIQREMWKRDDRFYDIYKRFFGFVTTGPSRNVLYSAVLQNAAKRSSHLIADRKLSMEIRGLVVKDGRIDHRTSGNDDMVIAWLLANWVLTHAKNLEYYGIPPGMIMSVVSEKGGKTLTPQEAFDQERQRKLREELDEHYEQLQDATSHHLISKLEYKIRSLANQIQDQDYEARTIDEMLRRSAEERAKRNTRASFGQRELGHLGIWNR